MHLFDRRSCTEELHQRYRVVLGIQGGVFVLNGIMIDYSGDGPLPTLTSDISHLIELIPVQNHHRALGAEKTAVGSGGKRIHLPSVLNAEKIAVELFDQWAFAFRAMGHRSNLMLPVHALRFGNVDFLHLD